MINGLTSAFFFGSPGQQSKTGVPMDQQKRLMSYKKFQKKPKKRQKSNKKNKNAFQ